MTDILKKSNFDLYDDDFPKEIGRIYFDPILEEANIIFQIDELSFSENPLLWCDLFKDLVGDMTRQYEEMLDMMRAINSEDLPL